MSYGCSVVQFDIVVKTIKAPRPHMPNHQMNLDGKISGFGALSWKELSEKLAEKLAVA